jgi:sugar transferase (PEP-CTERM/EpsH1 system associated)
MMRVLMLTHRLPYAPNRGDRLRAYHMLRHLHQRAEVDVVSLVHDDEEASHVDDMRSFVASVTPVRVSRTRALKGVMALATNTPLTHALLDSWQMGTALRHVVNHRRPDVVFAYCSSMAKFAMRPPLDTLPMVLDFVDVDSEKWRAMAGASRSPLSWIYRREAETLGAFEACAARRASTSLVVNARESDLARALAPDANLQVISNGVELDRLRPPGPPAAAPRLIFCGVMNYAPNAEGIAWFVEKVWPLIRARRADATLAIVGADPSASLRTQCHGDSSITITGRVPDVRDWLWESAVAIAPLHVARGVQNKALEAIAAGLPIVMTEAVAGGLPPAAAYASLVANTPPRFADHVLALLARAPEERRRIAQSADLSGLTWSRTLEPLMPILERAAQPFTQTSADSSIKLRIRLPIANQ